MERNIRLDWQELVEEAIEEIIYQDDFIQETIKEMLLTGGLLKSVITEVAQGIAAARGVISESVVATPVLTATPESTTRTKMQILAGISKENTLPKVEPPATRPQLVTENKGQAASILSLEEKIGIQGVFAGTEPLTESAPYDPMSGVSPDDSGAHISTFFKALK